MLQSNLELQTKNILNSNQYNSVRRIGKGGFGHVLLATKATSSSTFYAVKCISKKKMIKDPLLKKFLFQQINTMASLDHPNIVKLHKTFEQGDWYFLVMEYCDMGNLYNFQNKLNSKNFSKQQAVNIFNQILRGVEFIHKNNIIHRDLKMQNIFLKKNSKNGNYVCKIGDFGLARQLQGTAITNCGTQTYMAPEILSSLNYDKQADIWSLGVLLYYAIFGQFPFKGMNFSKLGINILNDIHLKCSDGFCLMDNIKNKSLSTTISSSTSIQKLPSNGNHSSTPQKSYSVFRTKKQEIIWSDIFQRIFEIDPKKRISLAELKEHPVLKKKEDPINQQAITNDEDNDEMAIEWQFKRLKYLQDIVRTIQQAQFLSSFLACAYKFYLNKVMLYFLNKQTIKSYRKDEQSNPKILLSLSQIEKQILTSLQKEYSYLIKIIQQSANNKEYFIDKFDQGFNLKVQDFADFKMAYRNTVGKVYEEVHRKFADNSYERAVLKLKVFICHIVNRVFSGNSVNEALWPYYFAWMKKNSIEYSAKYYDFKSLQQWMRNQKTQNLQRAQQTINQMFYK